MTSLAVFIHDVTNACLSSRLLKFQVNFENAYPVMNPEAKASNISNSKDSSPFSNPKTAVALSLNLACEVMKIGLQGNSPEPIIIGFEDICAAEFRISKRIQKTPCEVDILIGSP